MSLKMCVIGCGDISIQMHGPSYRQYAKLHEDVILSGCCDLDAEKAKFYKEEFGFATYYTDMDTMLDKERPDAVCLIVPPEITASLAIRIMQQGYPLLVEKPPGMNKEEAETMLRAATEAGVANQVAFNRRHMPLVQQLKSMLQDYTQPEHIHHIHYDFSRVGRQDADFSTTAIHGIDTVRYLAKSDYKHIYFSYQSVRGYAPHVVNIYMNCVLESGVTAFLSFCPTAGAVIERAAVHALDQSFIAHLPVDQHGVDGYGVLQHIDKKAVRLNTAGDRHLSMFEHNGFYGEIASFFNDVRLGRKPADSIQSGLQSVEVAECIRLRLPEYSK